MRLTPDNADLITARFGIQSRGSSEAARRIEAAGLRKQKEDAKRIGENSKTVNTLEPKSAIVEITNQRPQIPMIEPKARELVKRERSSSGLRDVLFDAIEEVRVGKISAEQAAAVCHLTKQILSSVRVEIEASKMRKDGESNAPPLQLGSDS